MVSSLAMFNGAIIIGLIGYARHIGMPTSELIPLVLTAVLASIPVALPATFTLAAALGARALAKVGVLPTRLSAVDEAGGDGCALRGQDRHADPQCAVGDRGAPLGGVQLCAAARLCRAGQRGGRSGTRSTPRSARPRSPRRHRYPILRRG